MIADALKLEPFLVPPPPSSRGALAGQGIARRERLGHPSRGAGRLCALRDRRRRLRGLLHLSSTLRRAFYPLLVASQTVPIVVVAPILVVWLGFGIGPKLAIIGLICFFPITVNTLDGLGSVDPDLVKMMRTLDSSRWQTLRRIEAPTALPYFFSGAKIAVAVAVIGAVFGEWAGSSSGLGHLIQQASASSRRRERSPPSWCSRRSRSPCSRCSRRSSEGSPGGGRTGPEVEPDTRGGSLRRYR